MATALERLNENMEHAGDAGSLYTRENELLSIHQYDIERILEACGYPLTDDTYLEDDIETILAWIKDRKEA